MQKILYPYSKHTFCGSLDTEHVSVSPIQISCIEHNLGDIAGTADADGGRLSGGRTDADVGRDEAESRGRFLVGLSRFLSRNALEPAPAPGGAMHATMPNV